jgi:pyrroloquinoline quinone (PQQ) biosynthesis protein C
LSFLFLLAIPTAVRWLRPALAHGMSPAYVALSDRPG